MGNTEGRPKLTEVDRIWNRIRDSLTRNAMKNMTIPQAKVFSAEAALHIAPYVRELIDAELKNTNQTPRSTAIPKEEVERAIGEDEEPGRTFGPGIPGFQRDQLRREIRSKLGLGTTNNANTGEKE
jgi:hypothetical protein